MFGRFMVKFTTLPVTVIRLKSVVKPTQKHSHKFAAAVTQPFVELDRGRISKTQTYLMKAIYQAEKRWQVCV